MPGKTADPANPEILELTGTLEERKDAFKQLVKTTAVHRLLANQRNLKLWELLVQQRHPHDRPGRARPAAERRHAAVFRVAGDP